MLDTDWLSGCDYVLVLRIKPQTCHVCKQILNKIGENNKLCTLLRFYAIDKITSRRLIGTIFPSLSGILCPAKLIKGTVVSPWCYMNAF